MSLKHLLAKTAVSVFLLTLGASCDESRLSAAQPKETTQPQNENKNESEAELAKEAGREKEGSPGSAAKAPEQMRVVHATSFASRLVFPSGPKF